jgi:uncharacterized protein YhhL (DUF1145 family)
VTTEIEARRIRARVLLGLARIALLILFAVVVFRIAVPYLFDLHTDIGLVGAVGVGLLGLAVLIWMAFDITVAVRRFRRRDNITPVRRFRRP